MPTYSITTPLGGEWSSAFVVSTFDFSTYLATSSDDVRVTFGGECTRDDVVEGLEKLKYKVIQSVNWPPA